MYDSGKIILGLIVFVGLFTSPIWYDMSSGKALNKPNLILPTKADQKECVGKLEFMRCDHMVLLDDWRYEAVRQGDWTYVSADGKKFDIGLRKTCLNCHSNTAEFCDQCHNYVGVNPYCWDCHNEPQQLKSR